jgi:hypothetical protein
MKMPEIASNTLSSWCFAFVAFRMIFLVFYKKCLYFYTTICFIFLVINASGGAGMAVAWGIRALSFVFCSFCKDQFMRERRVRCFSSRVKCKPGVLVAHCVANRSVEWTHAGKAAQALWTFAHARFCSRLLIT